MPKFKNRTGDILPKIKGAIYGRPPEYFKNLMSTFCQYSFYDVDNPLAAPNIAMSFKATLEGNRKHY